jgi:hypothetical protein
VESDGVLVLCRAATVVLGTAFEGATMEHGEAESLSELLQSAAANQVHGELMIYRASLEFSHSCWDVEMRDLLIDRDYFDGHIFNPVRNKAGLPRIRFHDLRHFFASMLVAQGESPKSVSDQVGSFKYSDYLR